MAVARYQDLIAWQLADQFKSEVFRLVKSSTEASRNLRSRNQLLDPTCSVASNLVEGFRRFSPGEFARFIDYSLASLGEAEQRLHDGIALGYLHGAGVCRRIPIGTPMPDRIRATQVQPATLPPTDPPMTNRHPSSPAVTCRHPSLPVVTRRHSSLPVVTIWVCAYPDASSPH